MLKVTHTLWRPLGALAFASLATAGLSVPGIAQARDVYWSVGVNQPGVSVGVSNLPYGAGYAPPRAVYAPGQWVWVPPRPVAYGKPWPPGWYRHGHRHKHHRHDRWERDHDDDRHERPYGRGGDERWYGSGYGRAQDEGWYERRY